MRRQSRSSGLADVSICVGVAGETPRRTIRRGGQAAKPATATRANSCTGEDNLQAQTHYRAGWRLYRRGAVGSARRDFVRRIERGRQGEFSASTTQAQRRGRSIPLFSKSVERVNTPPPPTWPVWGGWGSISYFFAISFSVEPCLKFTEADCVTRG